MNILNIGLTGLNAAQLGAGIAGMNLANLATAGYSRRGVVMTTQLGGGVQSDLMRFNDSYKNQQLWSTNAKLGQYSAVQSYLNQLEGVVGLHDHNDLGLGKLFDALTSATTNPADDPLRQGVLNAADSMVKQFNNMNNVLAGQIRRVEQQRETTVTQVNSLASSIAVLNKEIAAAQGTGADVSALLDQRHLAIDQLSGLTGARVLEQPNGMIDVALANGQPLVQGADAGVMSVGRDAAGRQTVSLQFGAQNFKLDAAALGGELRGLATFEQETLRPHTEDMKALATEIADRFNAQQAAGFDRNGRPGVTLFIVDPVTGQMTLNPAVGPDELAFSNDPAKPGDGSNLSLMIDIRNQAIVLPGIGNTTIDEAFATMTGKIGSASQTNRGLEDTALAVRTQAQQDWMSVSGVLTDEEGMNLVFYQQMAEANMKVISVANELFTTMLNAF